MLQGGLLPALRRDMLKRLLRRPGVQALLAAILAGYLRVALRTTRWTLIGAEHLAPHAAGAPAIAALWHECLPLMPALWLRIRRPGSRACALASRHNDGRLLGEIMRRFGLDVVHGSSARDRRDKGGAAGVRALLDALASGSHVVLTPDGPRGPAHRAAPGVAQLAGLSGCPVLPCAAHVRWAIRLPTWDRMPLPLPFGRGTLVVAPAIAVPRDNWPDALAGIAAALDAALHQARDGY